MKESAMEFLEGPLYTEEEAAAIMKGTLTGLNNIH
jgi:hypothetical protein